MPSANKTPVSSHKKKVASSSSGASNSNMAATPVAKSSRRSSESAEQQQKLAAATRNSVSTDKTSANPHGHPPDKKWAVNEKVLCRYLNSENIYYEAKVMFLKELPDGVTGYGIHYPGWSSRHDEVIPHYDALIRFRNYSEDEAAKAKEEIKRAQKLSSAKKRKSQPEQKSILEEGSRSSTPGSTDVSTSAKRKQARRSTAAADISGGPSANKKDMPQVILPDTLRRILIDDENLVNKQYMLPKLPARITVHDIVQKYRESVSGGGAGGAEAGAMSPREFYIEYADRDNVLLNPTSENLEQSALGLLDYFETAVGTILLYKFERPAFNDLVEELKKQKSEEAENESEAEQRGGAGSELETNKPSLSGALNEKRLCFSKQFGLPHLLRMFVRFTDMLAYTEWSERSLEAIIRHAQDFVMFLSKNHADFYDVEKDYILAPAEYHKRVWGNHS